MLNSNDGGNILSVLDGFSLTNPDDVAKEIAVDFRNRRIEKGITREAVAEKAGVALSNVARFEQKGLVSLGNLIRLASALGYVSDIRHIFSEAKYSTMDELRQIRRNKGKKKAYQAAKKISDEESI